MNKKKRTKADEKRIQRKSTISGEQSLSKINEKKIFFGRHLETYTALHTIYVYVTQFVQKLDLTLFVPGYFYTLFVPGGGGANLPPLPKNRLVSGRSKIFGMLKLFFVKFVKIKILRS